MLQENTGIHMATAIFLITFHHIKHLVSYYIISFITHSTHSHVFTFRYILLEPTANTNYIIIWNQMPKCSIISVHLSTYNKNHVSKFTNYKLEQNTDLIFNSLTKHLLTMQSSEAKYCYVIIRVIID